MTTTEEQEELDEGLAPYDPDKEAEELAALEAAHKAEVEQDQADITAAAQDTQEKIEADQAAREEQHVAVSAEVMESLTAPRQAMEALVAGTPITDGEVVVED